MTITKFHRTAVKKKLASAKGNWVDPGFIDQEREFFLLLFKLGKLNRRLHPVNRWSYQYQIRRKT